MQEFHVGNKAITIMVFDNAVFGISTILFRLLNFLKKHYDIYFIFFYFILCWNGCIGRDIELLSNLDGITVCFVLLSGNVFLPQRLFLNKLSSLSLLLIDIICFGIYQVITIHFNKDFVLLELIVDVVGAMTAFVIFIRLSKRLSPKLERKRLCNYVIKNNFYIYLLHQQIIFFVITFLNGKVPAYILALCNFVFSLAGSMGIIWLLQKIRRSRRDGCKEK